VKVGWREGKVLVNDAGKELGSGFSYKYNFNIQLLPHT
jgi:hypothetical protein